MALDWMIVKNSWSNKPIGAVGFIGNNIAVITAFYEDKDANQDGEIQWYEKAFAFGDMKGKAIAEVANQAYADPDILMRDPSLYNLRGRLTVEFAAGLAMEGIYRSYFSMGIKKIGGTLASQLTNNAVKGYMIKKGFEKTIQELYREGFGR